jgi:UDPglucose 6-dehydrogenase
MRDRAVIRLQETLKILKGRTIAVLGLAFKPHTDDLRDAPAIDIMNKLIERGAMIKAHDPIAMERFRKEQPHLASSLRESVEETLADADAAILTTEWPEYIDLDWKKLGDLVAAKNLVDTRLVLDLASVKADGWNILRLP